MRSKRFFLYSINASYVSCGAPKCQFSFDRKQQNCHFAFTYIKKKKKYKKEPAEFATCLMHRMKKKSNKLLALYKTNDLGKIRVVKSVLILLSHKMPQESSHRCIIKQRFRSNFEKKKRRKIKHVIHTKFGLF